MSETAQFPGQITTQIPEAVARKSTTLTNDITAEATEIPVASLTGFPSSGFIVIENETIYYSGKSVETGAGNFTGCTRGYDGTAVSHKAETSVNYAFTASMWNRMKAELVATQTKVGIDNDTNTDSLDYKVNHIQTSQIADGAVTTAKIADASQTPSAGQIPILDANGDLDFPADRTIKTDVKARAYLGATQFNIPSETETVVPLDAESYDVGSDFDTVNFQFVAPVTGYYLIVGQILWGGTIVADKRYQARIKKNGTATIAFQLVHASIASGLTTLTVTVAYLNINDTIKLVGYHDAGTSGPAFVAGVESTYLEVHLLSV